MVCFSSGISVQWLKVCTGTGISERWATGSASGSIRSLNGEPLISGRSWCSQVLNVLAL